VVCANLTEQAGPLLTPLIPPSQSGSQTQLVHTPASVALAMMHGTGKDILHSGSAPGTYMASLNDSTSSRASPVHPSAEFLNAGISHSNSGSVGYPSIPLGSSRGSSGLVPLPSRTSSGLNITPSKTNAMATVSAAVSLLTGVGGGSNSSLISALGSDSHGVPTPVDKDRHLSEWGMHLMYSYMAQSTLANELRSVYHNVAGDVCCVAYYVLQKQRLLTRCFCCDIGGHSLNVTFNGVKSGSTALYCKDRHGCEESVYLSSLRYCVDSDSLESSCGTNGGNKAYTSINMRGISAGGSRSRLLASQRSGNLTAALGQRQQGPGLTRRLSNGKKSRDAAKMKGINLNTQTMLKIADSDTIMNVLHNLDSTTFNVIVTQAEISEANSATNSMADFQSQAIRQQMRIHSSSRLFNFIDASDPTQSFLDLSLTLDEPVEEVRLAIKVSC
jgi:hypothetical protein